MDETPRKEDVKMIKMEFNEIRQNAVIYKEAEQSIDEMLTRLERVQVNLEGAWKGKAMEAFAIQFSELQPRVKEFSQLMGNIEKQLLKIAQTVEDVDISLQQAIMNE